MSASPEHRSPGPPLGERVVRWVLAASVVVIIAAVAVIALKLGARPDPAASAAGSPSGTSSVPDAAGSPAAAASPTAQGEGGTQADQAASGSALPAPVTSAAPHPKAPSDPADLGVLVNKRRPLSPVSYAPKDLTSIGSEQLRKDAAAALTRLLDGARRAGHPLNVISGYRSAENQEAVHRLYVQRSGSKVADSLSARAGYSEHQTGLAADLSNGTCELRACFGDTAAGKWIAAHAHEYGFVVRYEQGQEKTTGYRYEPWHLRYLGPELTKSYLASGARSLEEYYGL